METMLNNLNCWREVPSPAMGNVHCSCLECLYIGRTHSCSLAIFQYELCLPITKSHRLPQHPCKRLSINKCKDSASTMSAMRTPVRPRLHLVHVNGKERHPG